MLAIYTRLSKEDKDSTSIDNQLREGKSFAKDNGFINLQIYNEGEGISGGAEIKDRPQLFQLLQDFRSKKIKGVWFRNQNRLERNSSTWHIFITEAKKYNIDVYFNDKLFDYDNPQENLFGSITSALNQYQKDLQSAQTKRSLNDNVKEGKVWSIVAYGYKSDNGFLAIDEKESKIVKEIYALSLSGKGYNTIANYLIEKEIPTRKKTIWRSRTIQSIIKNPLYKGVRIYGEKSYDAPIIIEPYYWQKVNDNLENNKNNSGKKVEHKYLLKGLIKCHKCGKNYYGRRRVDKSDNFYSCVGKRYKEIKCINRGINIDVLENFIWDRFFADKRILELTKDFLRNDEIEEKLKKLRLDKINLGSQLKSNEKESKKAIDILIKGLINDEEFERSKARIKKEQSDLLIKIKNNSEQIDFFEKSELTKEKVDSDFSLLKEVSFNDKRDLIKKYIDKIVIDYNKDVGAYNVVIVFKINDYFIYDDAKTNSNNNMVEGYVIDRNYDVAFESCYKFIFALSPKAEKIFKGKVINIDVVSENQLRDIEGIEQLSFFRNNKNLFNKR